MTKRELACSLIYHMLKQLDPVEADLFSINPEAIVTRAFEKPITSGDHETHFGLDISTADVVTGLVVFLIGELGKAGAQSAYISIKKMLAEGKGKQFLELLDPMQENQILLTLEEALEHQEKERARAENEKMQ